MHKDVTPAARQQLQHLIPPQPLQHRQYIQNAGPSADPFRYQSDANINHPSLRQLQNYPTPYAPQPQLQPQPYQKIYVDPTPIYVPISKYCTSPLPISPYRGGALEPSRVKRAYGRLNAAQACSEEKDKYWIYDRAREINDYARQTEDIDRCVEKERGKLEERRGGRGNGGGVQWWDQVLGKKAKSEGKGRQFVHKLLGPMRRVEGVLKG